uniref:Golgi-associated, gamma adaptin ear containing, ARF binding protein 1 n=1 Tax=Salarias fasciatus TaxID=181472 RepID=A0A672ISR1_SALFA
MQSLIVNLFFLCADKATNPLNKDTDWDNIKGFCDQLNNEPEGPQLATRLLAHKIQSPQEWEAIQALLVLETCMKSCGKRFHNEVGKFRFLNELIKVVSPKYLGARAPEPVKKKVLEMMYSWTLKLPDETKIADAYQMLKKQGIVKQDPVLPDDRSLLPAPPRAKCAIFEDEEKSKVLFRNVKSRACCCCCCCFQDQKRVEKVSKRVNAIQEVKESVSLLSQLLEGYSKESCSQSNQELIKDLYQRCEKMRPTLFRLASDTEDSDDALADILEANDSLTQVINTYRRLVKGEDVTKDVTADPPEPGLCLSLDSCCSSRGGSSALVDLTGLHLSAGTAPSSLQPQSQSVGVSLLDDELMSLGKQEPHIWRVDAEVDHRAELFLTSQNPEVSRARWAQSARLTFHSHVTGSSAADTVFSSHRDKLQPQSRVSLRDLQTKSTTGSVPAPPPASSSQSEQPDALLRSTPPLAADPYDAISLSDVAVPLDSIKPSSLLPVTVFDKHSLRVLFTFARDCPPSRPDVLVVIISMLSSAPIPVTNIRFQAAVPKVMKVKLQPPSSTELPAFNPILPPAAVTQILLLANPQKEKVRLRYKLTFDLGDKSHDESGDVDQFPPPNTWGSL